MATKDQEEMNLHATNCNVGISWLLTDSIIPQTLSFRSVPVLELHDFYWTILV